MCRRLIGALCILWKVFFNESITVIITLVTLIYISPQLTLFVLLILPVSGLIIGRIGKTLKRESIKGQGLMGDLLSLLDETISGNRIIKAFNAEKYLSKKFTDDSMNYYHVSKSMQRKKRFVFSSFRVSRHQCSCSSALLWRFARFES